MSFAEQVGECLRMKSIRILLLILLLVLIGVGVFLLVRSPAESDDDSLDFGPRVEGQNFIRYQPSERKSVLRVIKAIDEYLQPYNSTSPNLHKSCSFYNPPPAGKTCEVDLKSFDPCVKEKSYDYFQSQPCVFLKLAKDAADWVPKFYNESKLPAAMPSDLQDIVRNNVKNDKKFAQFVWVSCDGKSDTDKKNIGAVRYLPRQGFPGYFYPCSSQEGCSQPIVALQFLKPKLNEKIFVECKMWSENVVDSVEFELMVESL